MDAPFQINPILTGIAIAYTNEAYIADRVLPRTPVAAQQFKYLIYNKAERFTIPDTLVGRTARPNEIEFGATLADARTEDYGLEDPIPQADISQAPGSYSPEGNATESLTDLILLDREKRTADKVFDANTYPVGSKTQLAGNDQWSDYTNSNPIDDVLAALDAMLMRANVWIMGRAVFTKLIQHPKIVQAIYGTGATVGIVTRLQLAALFDLQEVLVGESWYNSAKKGQSAVFARLWGKHSALLYRNSLANTQRGVTFGLTAEWGTRVSGSRPDPDIGLRGGTRVRVGESVKELVVASDCGYFFQDSVA